MQESPSQPPLAPPLTGPRRSLALRFISGKYQGGEFPVIPSKQIIVGRSSDLDMVLVEEMVSRKHARISYEEDQVIIEDLGSTNGTFVNGEKVKRVQLKEGDRVLIGTSILKLIVQDSPLDQARPNLEIVAAQRRTASRTMSGAIEEVPLPDLLQLFSTSKKSGVLMLRTDEDVGRIFLRKGSVHFATINDLVDISPAKCIFRMLTWQKGVFDFDPSESRDFPNPLELSVPEILMDSIRELDELNVMRDKVPPLTAVVTVCLPLSPPLRNLEPIELDIIQLAHNHRRFGAILDRSQASDTETARIVLKLIEGGYLSVSE